MDRAKHGFRRADNRRVWLGGIRSFRLFETMRTLAVRFRVRDSVGLFRILPVRATRFRELLFVCDVRDGLRSGNFEF